MRHDQQIRAFVFSYQNRKWTATLWKNSQGIPAKFWNLVPKEANVPGFAEYDAARRYLERLVA